MSSKAPVEKEFVDAIAEQVAACVQDAVERWMAEFDSVLQDPHLTPLGRLQALSAIVARYRHLRGSGESPLGHTTGAAGWGVC